MTKQPANSVSAIAVESAALTPREWSVVRYVAQGYTYRQVAHLMGTAEQTIKNQMWSVHHKLDVQSTIQVFIKLGWLHIDK